MGKIITDVSLLYSCDNRKIKEFFPLLYDSIMSVGMYHYVYSCSPFQTNEELIVQINVKPVNKESVRVKFEDKRFTAYFCSS